MPSSLQPVETSVQIAFALCATVIVYHYALYPLIAWCLARALGRHAEAPAPQPDDRLPSVALLIAAHNEQAIIRPRIDNALDLDYPPRKLQIVIGSDGSTDRTAEIVRDVRDPRVRLLDYRQRRGKASVLNSALAELTSDVVVFSDANTFFDPQAVRKLVRWLDDPSVGSVCGRLVLTDPKTGGNADGLYWRYETFIKRCEGALGALPGANGAIYAIRREHYVPLSPQTMVDDLAIPLLARLRDERAIVYDGEAIAFEESAPEVASEFRRRARIGAGGWQAVRGFWPLLDPRRGWIALTFFSHKVLRWICPLALAGLLLCAAALCRHEMYRWLLAAQLLFYAASLLVMAAPSRLRLPKLLRLAGMFTSMNAALFLGLMRGMSRRQEGVWARTPRAAELAPVGGG
jgi:cellulose synthase/poly-beta-1,6-N-acetylglucosamine synthase-like glycosyltransferase